MNIYCIGDLHLSGQPPKKPMDVFGAHWLNHAERIRENWLQLVQRSDVVIVCGDISWGMTIAEADEDLQWLRRLPGRKLLLRGNHDYWWASLAKLRKAYPDLEFIQNDYVLLGDLAICGSRGWKVPSAEDFTQEDEKIYARELLRLGMGLEAATQAGAKDMIVALHYPPIFRREEENGYTELFRKYPVSQVLYGHLHGENNLVAFEGEREGIGYKLCSCDTQGFIPVLIRKSPDF